ncbi:type 4a pilus biogenesis protein PilO [Vibrio porteresiae]|uniref:Type 4a pilus biogenesis protein PilO n=1 Tax=Vibrio porteresiae DSM 19223 TaxID=1123496 RepID=A0ABZ0QFA3_9VIBR|nr:type 4a pilus biogenesis protein PilO [Vibrio porteresiae]WPC74437.1 type 4a pilus biogenesis protein PilO [Vibrio porteresiae DSM 19223]
MKAHWLRWSQLFAERSHREKMLIALGGLVILFLALQMWVLDPVLAQVAVQQKKALNTVSETQKVTAEIARLKTLLSTDPNAEVDKQFASLQVQSQQLSMSMSQVMDGMVSPSEMANLLESVLRNGNKLKLISLTSLPAKPVGKSKDGVDGAYYIHPVRMELTGSYFAIRDYLSALESLPIKYYWHSFKYSVETYPQARMILVVYTIGSREEFIGG